MNIKEEETITKIMKQEHRRFVGFVRKRINNTAGSDVEDIVQDVVLKMVDAADYCGHRKGGLK